MEDNVIMNNEVIENTEEVVEAGPSKGLIALGVVGTILVGSLVYNKLIKPAIAKHKAKKAAKAEAEFEEVAEEA